MILSLKAHGIADVALANEGGGYTFVFKVLHCLYKAYFILHFKLKDCHSFKNGWLKYDHRVMYKKYTIPCPIYWMMVSRKTS